MSVRWEAIRALSQRYAAHFQLAWARRAEMEPPQRLSHEIQFLPAALSLQESPVHPAPRVAMYLIIGFAALALIWAVVGKVDIVATASGKIVPGSRTKIIQPLETATVKAIHVRDGQAVKAGDVLVELDATAAQADSDRTRIDWQQTRLDAARARAMLDALRHDGAAVAMVDPLDGMEPEKYAAAQQFLSGQFAEFHTKVQQLDAESVQHAAQHKAALENLHKLEAILPLITQRANDLRGLADENYVPRHDYLEKEQQRIETERDLAATRAHLNELDAVILANKRQIESLTAETQRIQLDQLREAEQKMAEFNQEFIKASNRRESMTMTAPVDGTVQQLAIHTVGGVVTPAQQLMLIVPSDNLLEVAAFVQNKDVGFVRAGQETRIKIETFPFTKYGTIQGTVLNVSDDAMQEDARLTQLVENKGGRAEGDNKAAGLVYAAQVRLEKSTMQVDGKLVNLTPGMAVTVEIKTGKRRLIEYFLSPLLQYKNESLRER